MQYRFAIADVFTDTPFGGNQLAVFPEAQGLSTRAMQALAREFNFAESTFVLPPADPQHARCVRIFTPRAELPFAGHPTVGTAVVLARLGRIEAPDGSARVVLEEGVGPVAVEIRLGEATDYARLILERDVELPPIAVARESAVAALSLPESVVRESWFASAGIPFCLIWLDSNEAVDSAALNRAAWNAHFAATWAPNLFLFAGETAPGGRLYARMFAPALGVDEDPATGSASVALVGSLAGRLPDPEGVFDWRIEQGVAMGRPSLIEASAERRGGRTVRLMVGGQVVTVAEGSMSVPDGY